MINFFLCHQSVGSSLSLETFFYPMGASGVRPAAERSKNENIGTTRHKRAVESHKLYARNRSEGKKIGICPDLGGATGKGGVGLRDLNWFCHESGSREDIPDRAR